MFNPKAVYGWCRFRVAKTIRKMSQGIGVVWVEYITEWVDEWQYLLLYYKILIVIRYHIYKRLDRLSKFFYQSGFMSENRGLHWDRKC